MDTGAILTLDDLVHPLPSVANRREVWGSPWRNGKLPTAHILTLAQSYSDLGQCTEDKSHTTPEFFFWQRTRAILHVSRLQRNPQNKCGAGEANLAQGFMMKTKQGCGKLAIRRQQKQAPKRLRRVSRTSSWGRLLWTKGKDVQVIGWAGMRALSLRTQQK